jgi:EAL domain-containing protein (putative c-di-GMP-specific phosphodiesterase class I)
MNPTMRSPFTSTERGADPTGALRHSDGDENALPDALREVMTFARTELQMEAAFVAEVSDDRRMIRVLDGDGASFGLEIDVGADVPGALWRAMRDGIARSSTPDPRWGAGAAGSPEEGTDAPSWVGVPIMRPDGRLYGTLCCLSRRADPGLARRDLSVMRMLARLVGSHLTPGSASGGPDAVARIRRAIDGRDIVRTVLQPIVSLATGEVAGFEALARFAAEPVRSPDAWFAEAAGVGLGVDLEMTTLRTALSLLERIPDGLFLSVNISPECIADRRLIDELERAGEGLLILELTEQDRVERYDELIDDLAELRAAGIGLAIDDVGSGFSTMTHVLQLEPDIVKLDATLTRGIELDPRRSTLIAGMTRFADAAGADLVAEGVETSREMETLRDLGVPFGQGFYLARPDAPDRHLERATARRRSLVRRRL